MTSGWVGLSVLAAATVWAAEGRPSAATLRRALEANRAAVVEVQGPHRRGAGVIVGSDGHVLTSTQFVALESAQVRIDGKSVPARVVMASADLKVAMLVLEGERSWQSAAVALSPPLAKGTWLVGLRRSQGKVIPITGQVSREPGGESDPFMQTDLFLPPGSPLLDTRGRLVAVTVDAQDRGSRALPLAAVKQRMAAERAP